MTLRIKNLSPRARFRFKYEAAPAAATPLLLLLLLRNADPGSIRRFRELEALSNSLWGPV